MKQSPSLCSPMATTHQSLPSLLPLLLLLYSQFSITDAQQTNITQEQQRPYNPGRSFTQVTAVLIIIMTAAIFFTGFFFVYIRSRRQAAVNTRFRAFIPEMRLPDRGLDPAVIRTFPTMAYSGVKGLKMGDSPLECAVCLSEFDDDDELTLLPVCDHVFHPHCIGTWLTSHSTCPVCRANLNVPLQEPAGTEVILNLEIRGENRGAEEDVPIDNHEEVEAGDQLRRTGIKRSINGQFIRPWRSKSARPEVGRSGSRTMIGKAWAEEERERFTLRLQESIRKDLVAGTSALRRSATTTELPFPRNACGEESPRMGYKRGAGGRSYRLSKPFGETARSGRGWVFGGDWGCGSSRGKAVGDGEPLDCITGVGTGGKGVDSGGDENDDNLEVNGGSLHALTFLQYGRFG